MIINFKLYEANKQTDKIYVNEYVICKEDIGYQNEGSKYFVENNIGKHILYEKNHYNNNYCIEFYNIPEEFIEYDFFINPISGIKNVRFMKRSEIIDHSKIKERLEMKLAMNKYNL